ncbi:MAG TPA: universal stress protein [Ktedonobacteraceae bacterium]|nr:universal stress protein [Ktedonobacteraceae bacterium]
MFQHILVPLDGSLRAEEALPVAARIARATGGSILLLQVVNQPMDFSAGLSPAPLLTEQVIESEMAEAVDYLQSLCASPILAGIESKTQISFGLPAQHILAVAQVSESDLIILCSHGRTGFTRWALGSVARTLVHQSTAPVLVLREGKVLASLTMPDVGPLAVLVPLDGSPLAEEALAPTIALTQALAAPTQSTLHLVQVVKPLSSSTEEGFVSEFNEEARSVAGAYLRQAAENVQAVAGHTLALTTSIETGTDVASTLLSVIEHGNGGKYSLIGISTHGRGGLERWVMGSVTERLLSTAKLPMLIVRPLKKG